MICKLRNQTTNILELPSHILIELFSFFDIKARYKLQLLNKTMKSCFNQAFLWKELSINNNNQIFGPSYQAHPNYFFKIVNMGSQLQVISLKFCQFFSADIFKQLNLSCNPFTLKELYLDGCDAVTDTIFDCLELSKEEKEAQIRWNQLVTGMPVEEEKTSAQESAFNFESFNPNPETIHVNSL